MKMFEKLGVGTTCNHVTDNELAEAKKVYGRYVDFLQGLYGYEYGIDSRRTAVSLAEFLLQAVDCEHLDSFIWDKGVLVTTKSGRLGLTVGWSRAGGVLSEYVVRVQTVNGVELLYFDDLKKADIPPEVLDYVKFTLQDKVHGKIDEAFKEN